MDTLGQVKIPFRYDEAWTFSDGRAWASVGGKWALPDPDGRDHQASLRQSLDVFARFSRRPGGRARSYIDPQGQTVIRPQYTQAWSFSEGLAAIQREEGTGFIDKTGAVVIPLRYHKVYAFFEGVAQVKKEDKWGMIDRSGKELLAPKYNRIEPFAKGLLRVQADEKWGIVDRRGRTVAKTQYDQIRHFVEGLAVVRRLGLAGLLDTAGREILPCVYSNLYPSGYRIYTTEQNGRFGLYAQPLPALDEK